MSDIEARLATLEGELKELRYLRDRQEILDCVARHARGCDRHDTEVLASAYHADGVDEHGFAINPGPEYGDWANEQHTHGSIHNLHHITTHLVEIEGDTAHAESYVIGTFLNRDNQTGRILTGRYIDRLERKDGRWGIMVRRSTVEVALVADATFITNPKFSEWGYLAGMRDKRDLSYVRPLDMEDHGHARW
jgi:SnoaL-like domain